jgi:hypothetical protein
MILIGYIIDRKQPGNFNTTEATPAQAHKVDFSPENP